MIITMNTETMEVEEHLQDIDKSHTSTELETRIANLIATALAGSAIKNYKHKNVRAEYIGRVAGVALDKVRKEPERV